MTTLTLTTEQILHNYSLTDQEHLANWASFYPDKLLARGFQGISHRRLPESEMKLEGILRLIGRAAVEFSHLGAPSGGEHRGRLAATIRAGLVAIITRHRCFMDSFRTQSRSTFVEPLEQVTDQCSGEVLTQ